MANIFTQTHGFKAVLDTTTDVANQTYTESAIDQILGANGGQRVDTYDHDKTWLHKGVGKGLSGASGGIFMLTANNWWKSGGTSTGTEPASSDLISCFYVKAESLIGDPANKLIITVSTNVKLAELAPGEGFLLALGGGSTVAEIRARVEAYDAGVDELTMTVMMLWA